MQMGVYRAAAIWIAVAVRSKGRNIHFDHRSYYAFARAEAWRSLTG